MYFLVDKTMFLLSSILPYHQAPTTFGGLVEGSEAHQRWSATLFRFESSLPAFAKVD